MSLEAGEDMLPPAQPDLFTQADVTVAFVKSPKMLKKIPHFVQYVLLDELRRLKTREVPDPYR